MCCSIDSVKTKEVKAKKEKFINVYKFLKVYRENNKIYVKTPYHHPPILVQAGWLVSEGVLSKTRNKSSGVIHCYLKSQKVKEYIYKVYPPKKLEIQLRCKAYLSDFVGTDYEKNHAVFKKIFIPLEEYDRVVEVFKEKFKGKKSK